jgi:hypothetical protein
MSQKYLAGTNRYTERLGSFTAEELLCLMRPEVEDALTRYGFTIEAFAPSQSLRAKRLLGYGSVKIDGKTKFLDRADRALLEDFLAVHRTVWILEGRAIAYRVADEAPEHSHEAPEHSHEALDDANAEIESEA